MRQKKENERGFSRNKAEKRVEDLKEQMEGKVKEIESSLIPSI